MTTPFDHIVLLVDDLAAAEADFTALGFTVQERADTEHGKTRFRFVSFEDGSYILLTSFATPEDQAAHRLGEVLSAGEGLADWSFTLPEVAETAAELAAAGHPVKGPVRVANVIADGTPWGLDLLMCGRGAGGDVALPFVVSDVEGRDARIPAPKPHANGATGMVGLRLTTGDASAVGEALKVIGCEETAPGRYAFADGWVEVLPLDTPGGRAGGGILEVVLTGPEAATFDAALTHGAPLSMEAR
ncbi:VOC family protein [Pseudoroseicyclus sp. H15]